MDEQRFDEIMLAMHQRVFHMEDADAEKVVDEFLEQYPELLEIHDRDWYIKFC